MKRHTFPRGVHPPEVKELTARRPVESLPPPEKLFVPLLQHFGSPAQPLVKKGDEVFLGQKIGEASGLFSAHVHSSVSGKVAAVDPAFHPAGGQVLTVTIDNDGQDRPSTEIKAYPDPLGLSPEGIRERVREAGIVGLGGAAFPTSVKLSPPKDKPIDTVIINGCECEPLLTADYRLMLEHPGDILKGAEAIRRATGARKVVVGVEDNKADALAALARQTDGLPVELSLLKTKYPQGAEKNLILALLDRKVPRGGLPFDVGVVVQNVGTAKAVWDALLGGKPLYERVLTVSGPSVNAPKNLLVRVGTPFQKILDFCGGLKPDAGLLVMGGPMMGISQWAFDVPAVKATSGLLAFPSPRLDREFDCIGCTRCVGHCPMGLVPTRLMKLIKSDSLGEAEKWGAMDCVECGCCQYICPSKILLVHWIRLGKNRISGLKRKKRA